MKVIEKASFFVHTYVFLQLKNFFTEDVKRMADKWMK